MKIDHLMFSYLQQIAIDRSRKKLGLNKTHLVCCTVEVNVHHCKSLRQVSLKKKETAHNIYF